ncbi:hypothetical protein N7G274_002799 [Stereocaulon virgatum]|uniref:Uncharacterized protein n=1 Tax=Stereocaulon virgatum TaxID=373712 RepID=A0ABR4AHN5_9LECA
MKNTHILFTSHVSFPPTSQPPKRPSISSFVCFSCRKHRSLQRYPKKPFEDHNSYVPHCHSCKAPMHHIDIKMVIPPHDNIKGWDLFYDFITWPWFGREHVNFCADIDPVRDEENQHWNYCRIRKEKRRLECDRCRQIQKRVPDCQKVYSAWNEVVY